MRLAPVALARLVLAAPANAADQMVVVKRPHGQPAAVAMMKGGVAQRDRTFRLFMRGAPAGASAY